VRDRYTGFAAESMRRTVEELPRQSQFWNVRTAKAKLAEVLALVRAGNPQFLQREGDEEPVVLISLDTMYRLLDKRIAELSFTEAMAPYMQRTSTNLPVPELGSQDRYTIPK
jgi:hypothetical protein